MHSTQKFNFTKPAHIVRLAFAVGIVLRLALALGKHQPIAPGGDAEMYVQMAQSFGQGHFLGHGHPPIYPLFLWFTFLLPGKYPFVTLIMQCFVSAALILIVPKIAFGEGEPAAGYWAAWWIALDPFAIYYSAVFLSETLFALLFVMACASVMDEVRNGPTAGAFASGILLSAATLCRGILLPCALFLIACHLIYSRATVLSRFVRSGICVLGFLLPFVIWSTYVHHYTGSWVSVDSHGWETLYWGFNPKMNDPDAVEKFAQQINQDIAHQGIQDLARRDAYMSARARQFMLEHPLLMLRLAGMKFLKFWSVLPNRKIFSWPVRLLSACYMIPFLSVSLIGLFWTWKRKQISDSLWMILGVVFIYTLTNLLFWTEIRYRVPLHPFLALWAGIGLSAITSRTTDSTSQPGVEEMG